MLHGRLDVALDLCKQTRICQIVVDVIVQSGWCLLLDLLYPICVPVCWYADVWAYWCTFGTSEDRLRKSAFILKRENIVNEMMALKTQCREMVADVLVFNSNFSSNPRCMLICTCVCTPVSNVSHYVHMIHQCVFCPLWSRNVPILMQK